MALMLDAFASLAIADGRPVHAATLLAAADAVREQYGLVVPPSYRRDFRDPYVARARAALDEECFAAAWAEGQAMSLDAALALAQVADASQPA